MDESLIWIILLLIIYVANFFLKKKDDGRVRGEPGKDGAPAPRQGRPLSPFEELFGEIDFEPYTKKQTPETDTYESAEEYRSEEQTYRKYEVLEDTNYKEYEERPEYLQAQEYQRQADVNVRSIYEKSIEQANQFKTLDEQVDLEYLARKKPETKKRRKVIVSKYARMLQNPQTAREAIVMAEILNRKYD